MRLLYCLLVVLFICKIHSDGSVIVGNGNAVRGNNIKILRGNQNKVTGNGNVLRDSDYNNI